MPRLSEILSSGVGGVLPMLMAREHEKDRAQIAALEADRAASVGSVGTAGNVGAVSKMKKGGYVKAADGCAQRGKTRGRMI